VHEVRIPKLGLDTLDCEVRGWLVKVGERVKPGTPLLEVETEKALVAIEADAEGVLREVHVQAGQTVAVGAIVGLIDD
jgi:2-oxoglutarate dehydrogenase E2 component (dihydrolipoamide succinyltransferase)